MAGFADTAGIPDPTAKLFNQLGLLFQVKALHAHAEPLMRRALAIFFAQERAIGRTHPIRVTVQGNYEILLGEMGRNEAEVAAAIELARREAGLA